MKLEVGMYVRTKAGAIAKITRHEHYWINKEEWNYITTDIGCNFEIESIIKASNNIIDLIEVGDIVVSLNASNILEYNLLTLSNIDELKDLWNIQGNIKSIVTKEQFENIKYSLEG